MILWLVVTIPCVLLTALVGFLAGIRYSRNHLLPSFIAGMNAEEIRVLVEDASTIAIPVDYVSEVFHSGSVPDPRGGSHHN